METIRSKSILKDLNAVLRDAEARFARADAECEVVLNEAFKEAFRRFQTEKGCTVSYGEHTTVVRNKAGQRIFIANQWFAVASFFVDFCTELLTYRELFADTCRQYLHMGTQRMKEFATSLKAYASTRERERFLPAAMAMLEEKFPGRDAEYARVADLLWRFATDYRWWSGSKTVDRHDFYISSLLSRMNVVNNNSEFLAIIVHSFASDLKLRLLVERLETFTRNLHSPAPCPAADEDGSGDIVAEPSASYGMTGKAECISISAASLARFNAHR